MTTFFRILAIVLLFFLSFWGIYGGWMLISDPSGGKFHWTVELLNGTPFNTFLIPGLILFFVNGLLPSAIATMTILKAGHVEWLIIIQGVILIGWLTGELLFNKELFVPELHYPLYGIGILLVFSGIILLKNNAK